MTPSEQCRAAGLKSLAELSRISKVREQTLINWHRNKPVLFRLVIAGAACEMREQNSLAGQTPVFMIAGTVYEVRERNKG